ncbi:MAG: serine hydrolase domain-containing protein [Planctomycetota bacterium]
MNFFPTAGVLMFAFFAALPYATFAAETGVSDQEREFVRWARATVEKRMRENDVPAVSVGVIREGKLLFTDGMGVQNRISKQQVTANSRFQIASQSKMLTGIVVDELLAEGRLQLDEPITKWIANSLRPDAATRLRRVTLRHLVHHRSGIPNYACSVYADSKRGGRMYWADGYSEEQLIRDLNSIQFDFEPGSQFSYSNSGYAIIGFLCEKATGQSYEELLQQYVIKRFELISTSSKIDRVPRELLVTPYYPHSRATASKPSDWGLATPASGVISSVSDLTRLMTIQLRSYRTSHDVRQPLMLTRVRDTTGPEMSYGYGIFRQQKNGYVNYTHGGDADGYACAYSFSPEKNCGLVLLSSSGGYWFGQLEKEIYSRLVGEPYEYTPQRKSLAQTVLETTAEKGIESGLALFDSGRDSNEYYLRESEMNAVAQVLIESGHLADAIKILKRNAEAFPGSWKALDQLGTAFVEHDQISPAIQCLQRSLSLNPNNDRTRNTLRQLRQQQLTSAARTAAESKELTADQLAIIQQSKRFSAAAIEEDVEAQINIYDEDAVVAPPGRPFLSDR